MGVRRLAAGAKERRAGGELHRDELDGGSELELGCPSGRMDADLLIAS